MATKYHRYELGRYRLIPAIELPKPKLTIWQKIVMILTAPIHTAETRTKNRNLMRARRMRKKTRKMIMARITR